MMLISATYSADFIIQYSIVGLIILVACGWAFFKMYKRQKKNSGPCCGCSIADSCAKKNISQNLHNHADSENLQRQHSTKSD